MQMVHCGSREQAPVPPQEICEGFLVEVTNMVTTSKCRDAIRNSCTVKEDDSQGAARGDNYLHSEADPSETPVPRVWSPDQLYQHHLRTR